MAHAFDNRNFIPGKQQTFYSVVSPTSSSASRPDATNVLWEASSLSPKLAAASPQASPKPNHPPPSYEESVFTKALANRHNSRSSLHSPSVRYYSNSPNAAAAAAPTSPLVSHSFPSTPNDSHQYQRPTMSENYYSFVSPNRSSDTKPPPPVRMPKVPPPPPQYSPNGMKTSTTYLNTTQLHITHASNHDQPPPRPPPRYPLQPPAIPPRNSPLTQQRNSISNSFSSPKPTSQTVYRSPIITSTAKRNDLIDPQILAQQFHSMSIENQENNQEYSLGRCRQCDRTITNHDDSCEILGKIYHSSCAVCVVCQRSVRNKHYFVKDQLYCEEDFLVNKQNRTKHLLKI